MNRLERCKVELLDDEACRVFLDWVTGKKENAPAGTFPWLLVHCHSGVTWGRFDSRDGCWRLSSFAFPELCPLPSQINLLELRLFAPESEILIWRTDTGLSGRRLADEPHNDSQATTRADEEIRILLGDRIVAPPKDGFTRVGTATGAEQAVPLECKDDDFKACRWPLRLKVRHYFEWDEETGGVRVAAGRLVDVFKEVR